MQSHVTSHFTVRPTAPDSSRNSNISASVEETIKMLFFLFCFFFPGYEVKSFTTLISTSFAARKTETLRGGESVASEIMHSFHHCQI